MWSVFFPTPPAVLLVFGTKKFKRRELFAFQVLESVVETHDLYPILSVQAVARTEVAQDNERFIKEL